MSLFKLSEEALALDIALEENEGELTPELEQQFLDLLSKEGAEIDEAVRYYRYLQAQAEADKAYANQFLAAAAKKEKQSKRIEEMIQGYLHLKGVKSVSGTMHTVSLKDNPPSVVLLEEEEKIVKEYGVGEERTKVSYHVDKRELLKRMKSGESFAFADIVVNQKLVIK